MIEWIIKKIPVRYNAFLAPWIILGKSSKGYFYWARVSTYAEARSEIKYLKSDKNLRSAPEFYEGKSAWQSYLGDFRMPVDKK